MDNQEDNLMDGGVSFAKLDFAREARTGFGETVFCPGKTETQLVAILEAFSKANRPVLCTKCSAGQFHAVKNAGLFVEYDEVSRILISVWAKPPSLSGSVAVCTGGTADVPVAEEAARTASFFGAAVQRQYDVGVAGLHRLLGRIEEIRKADAVIAVAGMEGALGSVLAGLVEAPVVAVPTSVGYGASFGGVAPLLSMLNSCAEGMTVVNIDNGFGAAAFACRMLRNRMKRERS
ncbi:MAG: nickel pincer cofactor biosynthesis protein LarB [Kiritimatiellae bacterium]|nr:nickel pincer cofactor biosynthesis protein LarB [Kiritimatiellia bacterium]